MRSYLGTYWIQWAVHDDFAFHSSSEYSFYYIYKVLFRFEAANKFGVIGVLKKRMKITDRHNECNGYHSQQETLLSIKLVHQSLLLIEFVPSENHFTDISVKVRFN